MNLDFVQYKCPCCGAALIFSPEKQKLACKSCGNEYDLETMKQYEATGEKGEEPDLIWENQYGAEAARRTEDGLYICPSCGAKIEADENTVSTDCPYCGNVVVIRAAASGEFKPDTMIPFRVEGKQARQMLEAFCKGKKLLPKNFKNKSYLKNLKGYYVPYWLFDCNAEADMSFDTTRTRMWSDSKYDYIETSHFLVNRSGNMVFYHVPVDGSIEMADEVTEAIEPFDYGQLTDFNPAYLAGYETDKYDVDSGRAQERAKERIYRTAENMMRSTVQGYESARVRRRHIRSESGKVQYALLPVWMFETIYNGEKYQFAINGQTGKMVGELPVDKGMFWKYLLGFTAIGTTLLSVLGILLFGGVL